ncbi:MAG: deoxyhypusine synthase [Phycisphaerae bacterium]|nr:deoxyhypusine synthase [Phycisphaerae bacterium]
MQDDLHPCRQSQDSARSSQRSIWFRPQDVTDQQKGFLTGRPIEPLRIKPHPNVAEMIDHCFAASGFNGRRLAEACQLYSRMLEAGATVGLTLSGAMTPIGMHGVIVDLMEAGFVDWIISTGANLFHDLQLALGYPMTQGHWAVDDNELAEASVARIYDVFMADADKLMGHDEVIMDALDSLDRSRPVSTATFHWHLGRALNAAVSRPDKSMLATAQQCDVPIYTSSPGDSSIAMSLVPSQLFGKAVQIDPIQDIIETIAIVRRAEENGVVQVGGGSPKNFYMQTQPTLHQVMHDEKGGGHDYFVQLTTDAPHWGGLSGATPSEAKSWGKVKDAVVNNVVVYSCASITFPLLAQYVLTRDSPRGLRRLYNTIDDAVEDLRAAAAENPILQLNVKALGLES